ncbi:MAG: ankyrin repeat domain-containing protein [Bacteroidota bacterium]
MKKIVPVSPLLLLFCLCTTHGATIEVASVSSSSPHPDTTPQTSGSLAKQGTIDLQELAHFSEAHAKKQFFASAERGEEAIMCQVLDDEKFKFDINVMDEEGSTAAHILTRAGHIDLLIKLHKEKKLSLTSKKLKGNATKGASILHWVAYNGDFKALKRLMDLRVNGLSVELVDYMGNNILFYAAREEKTEFIIKFCEHYGKELLFAQNNQQETLLFAALGSQSLNTFYTLLDYGTKDCRKELSIDYKKEMDGSGILHFLVRINNTGTIHEIFLSAQNSNNKDLFEGLDINTTDNNGWTPLDLADHLNIKSRNDMWGGMRYCIENRLRGKRYRQRSCWYYLCCYGCYGCCGCCGCCE